MSDERPTSVRLPRTYDEAKLVRDLESLKTQPRFAQPGPYHDGDWTGLILWAPGGDRPDAAHPQLEPAGPTPALAHAPYLAELLSELPAPKLLARLLTLPADAEIGEHNDSGSTFQFGSIRLHVPLVTHEKVIMMVGGERMRWRSGELWWGDFSQRHWLRNDSPVDRVHLVVDVQVTDEIVAMFPDEVIALQERTGSGIARYAPPLPEERRTDVELASFAGEFDVSAQIMPLFAGEGGLADMARDAVAVARPQNGSLVVSLDGRPSFALLRTGERRFSAEGLPPGVVVEFDDAAAPRSAVLSVHGLPQDLYAAQLGFQAGPTLAEQRFSLVLRQPA
jgi:hypothetical protein